MNEENPESVSSEKPKAKKNRGWLNLIFGDAVEDLGPALDGKPLNPNSQVSKIEKGRSQSNGNPPRGCRNIYGG